MTNANLDQHEAWNGESGLRWVAGADRRDAALAPVADLLAATAAVGRGEAVLDVGCGCGATTLAAGLATGPAGRAVGVDLSAPMLEVARGRTREIPQVELHQLDAQTDDLGGPFDVAMSRFGTMFFDDPAAAFANIARHLSPAGRLCIVTWQPLETNPWLVVPRTALLRHGTAPDDADPSAPGMFAQSDPTTVGAVLAAAGFTDVGTQQHTLPLRVGDTAEGAAAYLVESGPCRAVLETIPEDRRDAAVAEVADALEPHQDTGRGVILDAAVLVTTARRAPDHVDP